MQRRPSNFTSNSVNLGSTHQHDLQSILGRRGRSIFTSTSSPTNSFDLKCRGTISGKLSESNNTESSQNRIPRTINISLISTETDQILDANKDAVVALMPSLEVSPKRGSIFKDPSQQHRWQSISVPEKLVE